MIKHGHTAIAHSAVLRPQRSYNLQKLQLSDPSADYLAVRRESPKVFVHRVKERGIEQEAHKACHASATDLAGDAQLAPVACSEGWGIQSLQPVILQAGLALLPLHAQPWLCETGAPVVRCLGMSSRCEPRPSMHAMQSPENLKPSMLHTPLMPGA